jgi:hypothetical protein|tara:strand:+ start:4420 stop:4893 length:474 start_codon:yes stop_codon:yes gene_type:complete
MSLGSSFKGIDQNFSNMDVGLQGLLSKFRFDKQGRPILDVSGNIKLSEAGQAQLDRQKARPKRRRVLLPSTPHPFSGISSIAMNMARSQGLNGDSTQASPFTPNLGGFVPKFRLKAQPSTSTPTMPISQRQAGILSIMPRSMINRFGSGETVMQGMM